MTEKKKIEDFNDAMLAFQKLAVSATKEGKNQPTSKAPTQRWKK